MEKCGTCKFRYVEVSQGSQMFCRFNPPVAAPIVIPRPVPKIPMINGGQGGTELQIQWVSSFVPVTKDMGCGRHEPEAASMPIQRIMHATEAA